MTNPNRHLLNRPGRYLLHKTNMLTLNNGSRIIAEDGEKFTGSEVSFSWTDESLYEYLYILFMKARFFLIISGKDMQIFWLRLQLQWELLLNWAFFGEDWEWILFHND